MRMLNDDGRGSGAKRTAGRTQHISGGMSQREILGPVSTEAVFDRIWLQSTFVM